MRRIWFGILIAGVLILMLETGTISYFRDIERSAGNVFQAGTWKTQADDLNVDTSSSFVSNHRLHNINVSNVGKGEITIIKLGISWQPDKGEKVTKVWVIGEQPAKVWEGNESSNALLNIRDCSLTPPEIKEFEFLFDSEMKEKQFTIQFIMEDGSLKQVTFTPITKP
jgi:hypothetical protein